NTLSGIAVAPSRTKPLLGNIYGGLSGPAIKPIALRIVYEVSQVVDIPVVAIGGVTELADVLDFLAVGAVAVQVGTAIFADPTLPVRLVDELEGECRRRGFASYAALIGTALPRLRDVAAFDAWSTRILVHACRRRLRGRGRARVRELTIGAAETKGAMPASSGPADEVDERMALERAFERLDVGARSILVLHHL